MFKRSWSSQVHVWLSHFALSTAPLFKYEATLRTLDTIHMHIKKHAFFSPPAECVVRWGSFSLRAGAMSRQMGLARRQLMSQSCLWRPSRTLWIFTCLGCQVLPFRSLMQHGRPLNLFLWPAVSWPWLCTGQLSRGVRELQLYHLLSTAL